MESAEDHTKDLEANTCDGDRTRYQLHREGGVPKYYAHHPPFFGPSTSQSVGDGRFTQCQRRNLEDEEDLTSAEATIIGQSASYSTASFPFYRGGYLESDEEADCEADTNVATSLLQEVVVNEEAKTEDVKYQADVELNSSDNEDDPCASKRELYVSGLTTAGPVKNIDQDPRDLTKQVSYGSITVIANESTESAPPPVVQTSEPSMTRTASKTGTSTLDRITSRITKHFQSKNFTMPYGLRSRAAGTAYNLRSRAKAMFSSRNIKKTSSELFSSKRSYKLKMPQFFKKS